MSTEETCQKDPVCGGVFIGEKGISVTPKSAFTFRYEIHEHTHALSQTECQVTKVKAGINRRAEETEETAQQILGTEVRNISDVVAANLPSLETLRRNVHHSRQNRNMPPTPAHREDILDLPQAYRSTANGDPFLVYDNGVGDE